MSPRTAALGRADRQFVTLLFALGLAQIGCGDGAPPVADSPPAAPAADDPAFAVRAPRWLLVGDALTSGQDALPVEVIAPDGTGHVDAFVGDLPGVRLTRADGAFVGELDVSTLPPGAHDLLLAADSADVAFARLTINRSHALYVVVSTDWDDPDNTPVALTLQEELHDGHPELKLTHFVGPYTFTDPSVSVERRAELAAWAIGMRDDHGDEIGLHIHPWCSFVEAADVACRLAPSTVYPVEDPTGYTVRLNAYEPAELDALFAEADALFVANGLGKPTSFRAGGWVADVEVLSALARAGHVADTSANNWSRMEEWDGEDRGTLYAWNMANWASIDDTSQPYYPSSRDHLQPGAPHVGVLEVPDNGSLVDYVTREEMIEIFDANFDRSPLAEPRAYSIGYHPSNFVQLYKDRIHFTLLHVEQFLASAHRGPVVYARLSDLAAVWPPP